MADPSIRTGDLRHRVTLQSVSETPDSFGQPQETWSNVGTFWSYVKPLTGRELVQAKQIHALTTHSITLRYQPSTSFKATQRLIYKGRTFNLLQVLNRDERNYLLEVLANEIEGVAPVTTNQGGNIVVFGLGGSSLLVGGY